MGGPCDLNNPMHAMLSQVQSTRTLQYMHAMNPPRQHMISVHPINPSSQPTLSTHPINTSYQHILSIHPFNPPYQPHSINSPYQSTLPTHPINPPKYHTLSLDLIKRIPLLISQMASDAQRGLDPMARDPLREMFGDHMGGAGMTHPPYQHTLSTHSMDTLYRYTL